MSGKTDWREFLKAACAAVALCRMGGAESALPVFAEAFRNDDVYVGYYAADALFNTGVEPDPSLARLENKAVNRARRMTNLNAIK